MKRYTALLLLIICLGAGLRIYDLGRKSLWLDEGLSVCHAKVSVPFLMETLANSQDEKGQQVLQQVIQGWSKRDPVQPPLYYVFLHLWMAIGRDEFTIRFLSVLAGIVSIPVLYQLAKTLFNERVGLLSALLLAASPLHILYSQDARMYTMITFFVLVSVHCVVRFLRTKAWIWRVGYVLCMAVSLYIHYITAFALALQNIIVLIFVWQQREKKRLLTWLAMQACVLLLFAPWIPVLLYQLAQSPGNPRALSFQILLLPIRLLATFSLGGHGRDLPLWMIVVGLSGFFICTLYGLFTPEAKSAGKGKISVWMTQEAAFCLIYLLFPMLATLLFAWLRPPYSARFALFGLPAYYMLVARGIDQMRIGSKVKQTIVVALPIFLLFPIVTNIYQKEAKEDWRGVANYVLSKSQPDDVVALHASYTDDVFNYYAAGQISTYIGFVGVADQPQNIPAMVQEAVQGHKRLWLVLSHAVFVDPDGKVKQHLDDHYRMLEEKHFQAVDVFLYEGRD